MEGGPPCFPQDFTCLVVLRIPTHLNLIVLDGTLTRSGHAFQRVGVISLWCHGWSYNPSVALLRLWFGLFPVRSPLLRESRLISSRRATEMFQFTRCPPSLSRFAREAVSRHHSGGVAPFGISGFSACMQLPPNVSPVSASFFGLKRLGIHLVLRCVCSCLGILVLS